MSEQGESIENIMITTWSKETDYRQKISIIKMILLIPFGKKARYIYSYILLI